MRLSSLLKKVKIIDKINYFDCEIDELSLSSKEVFSKSLFFAVKGKYCASIFFARNIATTQKLCNTICFYR